VQWCHSFFAGGSWGKLFEKSFPQTPFKNFYGTADTSSGGCSHRRRKYLRRRGKEKRNNGAARRAEHREFSRCIAADLMWGDG